MNSISLDYMDANGLRGFVGFVGLLLCSTGAGVLWGAGGFLFVLGGTLVVDSICDEALERVTRVSRGKPPSITSTIRTD